MTAGTTVLAPDGTESRGRAVVSGAPLLADVTTHRWTMAALRLLSQLNGLALDDPRVIEVAQLTGADVPVCVKSLGCVMTGVGETLQPLNLPKMPCVMVNPGVPVATRDVFKALGLRNGELLVGVTDVLLRDRWCLRPALPSISVG